jgi:hypothetical protein
VDWASVANTAVVGLVGLAGGSVIPLLLQARARRRDREDRVTEAFTEFYVLSGQFVWAVEDLVFLYEAYSEEKAAVTDDLDRQWVERRVKRIGEVESQLDAARAAHRHTQFLVQLHGSEEIRQAADSVDATVDKLIDEAQQSRFVGQVDYDALTDARKVFIDAVREQVGDTR